MSLLEQWVGVSKYMVTDPDAFVEQYNENHGIGYPLKFLAVTILVALLPLAALSLLANVSAPVEAIQGAAIIVGVLGAIMLIAGVAEVLLAHLVVKLLGAQNGVTTTFEAYAFPAVVRIGLFWIPLVNLLMGLYGLYLQIKTLSSFQDVSPGRSAVAMIVAAMLAVPILIVGVAVIGAFVMDFGGGAGAAAP